jgi:Domain of unknown function (DUF1877)
LSVNDLRSRFSADAFNTAEIYPNPRPGGWNMEQIEGTFELFPGLQKLFEDALASDEVVIVYAA